MYDWVTIEHPGVKKGVQIDSYELGPQTTDEILVGNGTDVQYVCVVKGANARPKEHAPGAPLPPPAGGHVPAGVVLPGWGKRQRSRVRARARRRRRRPGAVTCLCVGKNLKYVSARRKAHGAVVGKGSGTSAGWSTVPVSFGRVLSRR